ncbi:MAG: hypothetical protein KTR31_04845, partial [Myxococcales bacterium]|nr:hypothetical protein [Myxococcales bacterium]
RSSNARRPSQWCDSGVNTSEPLWEVVGRFDEVTYLQVPEDARETWNADRDRSTPGPTTRLREGQLYVSDVFLNADRGLRGISCPRHQIVWIHGDPDSITYCAEFEESTP